MRIVVFNVKYSPNLGDGLLSECLEAELRGQGADVAVQTVDIAGRTAYGQGGRNRRALLTIMEWMPAVVRRPLAAAVLRRLVARRVTPLAIAALAGADGGVLGGGNLLADADLNFPIKIDAAMRAVADAGVPAAVFGVGVSDNWSAQGARLFRAAFTGPRLVHAAVRDLRSQAIWAKRLVPHGLPPAQLCRDPGLLAAHHHPVSAARGSHIGLCLTDPLALRYHGAEAVGEHLDAWLIALAQRLAGEGERITLFTNGSPEDRTYLQRLTPRFVAACGDRVAVEPAFADPGALSRFIGGCGMVIAHRMHACIAAYSYGVPHVGLAWDPKLNSFFASVDRAGFVIDPAAVAVEPALALVRQAQAEGIDEDGRLAVLAGAAGDVARMFADLKGAAAA